MSCRCHLCEPWNIMAENSSGQERLNELTAQRLAVHGLKPAMERLFPPQSPQPTVRLSDFPAGETLWRQHEEERLRLYLLEHMERARGHERNDPAGADAAPDGG